MNRHWKRAGIGVCGVTALVVGSGAVFAPAAMAATPTAPAVHTSGLLDGVVAPVLTTVGGVVTGITTPPASPTPPISVTTGGIAVGVGSTTIGVGTGGGTLGVGVTTGTGAGVGVVLGGTSTGTTIGGTVTNPSDPLPGTGTGIGTGTGAGSGTGTGTDSGSGSGSGSGTTTGSAPSTGGGSAAPIMLTALSATAPFQTLYPSKDGYRDSITFQLKGTTSDGQQHAASGVATLTFGSSTVTSWPITRTDQAVTWNGLKGGKVVPGRYLFTARIGDATGAAVTGTESIDVSAKKLVATTHLLTTKAVTGTHTMAAKPRAGLSKGKVTLKVTSVVKGVKGKQYLVFSHGGKKIKLLIRNGKHTSKAVTIPKSFTSYKLSHTWKKGVKITSLKYRYSFKALK